MNFHPDMKPRSNRELELKAEALQEIYLRGSGPVAFLDETYGTSADAEQQPFYLLTAVMVDRDKLDAHRSTLHAFESKPGFFHATEQFRENPDRITHFLKHINASPVDSVVTVQTQIKGNDKDQARDDCLVRMAYELSKGGSPVQSFIVESLNQRSDPFRNHYDQVTVAGAKERGLLHREMAVHHASPYEERLLWLPDVVSWAARQELITGNTQWIQNVETIRFVHAAGLELTGELGAKSGLKGRSSLVPQQSPGAQNLDGLKAGTSSVSSEPILESILESHNRALRDPEAMASAIARRVEAYRPKPEDRLVAGVSRNNERSIVEGVNQYAREQLPEGKRPRKSIEALIDRVQAASGTSKQAASAINDIRTRLEELKKNQVDQAKQGQPGRDDGQPRIGGHQLK